jgi:hypothetical protein
MSFATPSPEPQSHSLTRCLTTRSVFYWGLMAGLLLAGNGCIHRRLTIHSDPPGALVMLEGEEIGYTPCSVDFTHYGTRELTLIKDGYETLTVMQKVRTPWYQYTPVEFFADNTLLTHKTDRSEFTYRMRRQEVVPTGELLDRAAGLRSTAQIPAAMPSNGR